jgi:glyoxylase-like metal-dependent hydrolase (beta-lactamase superfamily II)
LTRAGLQHQESKAEMTVDIITIPLGFGQCYVLKGDGVIAIDAGEPGKGAVFVRALESAGINPHEVKLIVLTHGHWDHVGSAKEIKSLTGATLALNHSEVHWLENSLTPLSPGVTRWGKIFTALHKVFMPLIKVPKAKVDLVLDDDGLSLAKFGIPGRIVYTPGHSSGSVSVLLDTGEVFVGDLAMNKFPLRLSPGLPIFADDPAAVVNSWKMLIKLGASTVYPAHGSAFPIAVIENAIFRTDSR